MWVVVVARNDPRFVAKLERARLDSQFSEVRFSPLSPTFSINSFCALVNVVQYHSSIEYMLTIT